MEAGVGQFFDSSFNKNKVEFIDGAHKEPA